MRCVAFIVREGFDDNGDSKNSREVVNMLAGHIIMYYLTLQVRVLK